MATSTKTVPAKTKTKHRGDEAAFRIRPWPVIGACDPRQPPTHKAAEEIARRCTERWQRQSEIAARAPFSSLGGQLGGGMVERIARVAKMPRRRRKSFRRDP